MTYIEFLQDTGVSRHILLHSFLNKMSRIIPLS